MQNTPQSHTLAGPRARAFFQWKTKEDHAVERLVQKQGLLYGVTALAIKLATGTSDGQLTLQRMPSCRA